MTCIYIYISIDCNCTTWHVYIKVASWILWINRMPMIITVFCGFWLEPCWPHFFDCFTDKVKGNSWRRSVAQRRPRMFCALVFAWNKQVLQLNPQKGESGPHSITQGNPNLTAAEALPTSFCFASPARSLAMTGMRKDMLFPFSIGWSCLVGVDGGSLNCPCFGSFMFSGTIIHRAWCLNADMKVAVWFEKPWVLETVCEWMFESTFFAWVIGWLFRSIGIFENLHLVTDVFDPWYSEGPWLDHWFRKMIHGQILHPGIHKTL